MKKQALALLLVCLSSGPLCAGLSLGRPSAVKKQVSKLDDKVHAAQLAAAAANQPPVISAMVAVSTTVAARGLASVSISASDPDGDKLTYVWTSTAGTLSYTGSSAYWLAPSTPGVYAVTCVVSDAKTPVSRAVTVTAVPPGAVKWTFPAAGAVNVSPVIGADGTVYVVDDASHLYAIDKSGTWKWTVTTSGVIGFPPAVGADGTVYVVDNSSNAYAFKPDGTPKWGPKLQPITGIGASPVEGPDGKIYVYDGSSAIPALYALDPATGNGVSTFTALANGISLAPVRGPDGKLYIVSYNGSDDILYAVPASGLADSAQSIVTGIKFPPAVGADGSVYWSDGSHVNAALPDGSAKWVLNGAFAYLPALADIGPVIGLDGDIYVLDSGAGVEHVSSGDGSLVTAFGSSFPPLSQPSATGPGGEVYGVSVADISAARPDDTVLWGPFTAASPAAALTAPVAASDGTVYAGADDGQVYAFYSTSKLP